MKIQSIILLAIITNLSVCFGQNDIAQWRGPERNGIYPEKNLLTSWPQGGPELLWKYENLGVGYSSPVITSNKVYVIGTIDSISYVFNFDKSGNLLWKKPLGREWMVDFPGIRSTPTIYGNLGYVLNGLGVLYCFNIENGDIVWKKEIMKEYNGNHFGFGYCENLIVDDEKVYCTIASSETDVVALNCRTGSLIWKSKGNNESQVYGTPILIEIAGMKLFVNQSQKSIFSINTDNGKLAWKFGNRKTPTYSNTPIFKNGFLLSQDYNKESGSVKLKISNVGNSVSEEWTTPNMHSEIGDAIVIGDRIFGRGDRNLYCVDWNTGQEIYSEPAKTNVTTLISAENLLYSYDGNGNFSLLKPLEKRFEKVGSFQVIGGRAKEHYSHPAIKDGRLYVRHDNSLFVYNISK